MCSIIYLGVENINRTFHYLDSKNINNMRWPYETDISHRRFFVNCFLR
jgi:hypothetical protein